MKIVVKLLFILWITIAFFNVVYNTRKSISEVKEWGSLTIDEKRHKIFGDLYDFSLFINSHTEPDADFIITSRDGMTYTLSKYYIYPRTISSPPDKKTFITLAKSKKYKYLLSYNDTISVEGYEKLASFLPNKSNNYGIIYLRK